MSKIDIAFYEEKFDNFSNFVPIRKTRLVEGVPVIRDSHRRHKRSRIAKHGKFNKKTGSRYVRQF